MSTSTKRGGHQLLIIASILVVVVLQQANQVVASNEVVVVTRFDDPDPVPPCSESNCTLRAAILLTNQRPGSDEIVLVSGTYHLNLGGTNERWLEDEGYTADLDLLDDLVIRGAGENATRITETADAERAFDIHGTARVSIFDLQISGLGLVFAPFGCGKAIRNTGNLHLERVTLSRNSVRGDGGGICNEGGDVSVLDSVIEHNCGCVHGRGGGIYSAGGALTLDRVRLIDNLADISDGGGIYSTGSLMVKESLISGNRLTGPFGPKRGGGIFAVDASLTNVTISGNAAEPWPDMEPIDHFGGGLYVSGEAQLTNVTIVHNSSSLRAGGLYVESGGEARLANTIVANNEGGDCSATGVVSLGHNLAGNGTCGFSGTGDMNATDPLLAPLAGIRHGAGHSPLLGSRVIDAGDGAMCPSADQRGVERPLDGDNDGDAVCDIGAYEARFAAPGDIDCDGVIATSDGLQLLLALGELPAAGLCFSAADITGDGQVDMADVVAGLRLVGGLPP